MPLIKHMFAFTIVLHQTRINLDNSEILMSSKFIKIIPDGFVKAVTHASDDVKSSQFTDLLELESRV